MTGNPDNHEDTQLFLLRLWREEDPRAAGAAQAASRDAFPRWHGRVQHVVHGEAHAFAGWEMLIEHLEAMMQRGRTEEAE